ncbi:hypothetical protein DFQ26_007049 [Actinomortierella ambigua]|nr:hypothetical protein DFQ26_007049 [Actinomortierella ambigua]
MTSPSHDLTGQRRSVREGGVTNGSTTATATTSSHSHKTRKRQQQQQHYQQHTTSTHHASPPPTPPSRSPPRKVSEFDLDFHNEEEILAFREAIENAGKVDSTEQISAMTDFIPVQQKPRKRRHRSQYRGYSYTLLRAPLMILVFSVIAVEFFLYVTVRQIVNCWEYFVTWRGRRNRLRKALRSATTYGEWKEAALALDTYLGKDEWRNDPEFGFCDYQLLGKVNRKMYLDRQANRVDELKDVLQGVVKSNFAGVENTRLYSHTYWGTKRPVEDYVQEVTQSLEAVTESKHLTDEDKRQFLKHIYKNYGRTALCLSGGAGFGYYHLGVVRALLDAGVLPQVITGTSAGALLAALVGCRTDEELDEVLVPQLAHKFTACNENIFTWFPRLLRHGARFDAVDWARKVQWITRGSTTFLEAYERTGRILNISVIPYDPHSPPKLLNYLTTPDCVIWSSVIASAAIPGVLNPVVLMRKRPDGSLVPFSYGGRGYKDGSLRADIPLQALHTHFNVNYTIVSQVNPHIHLFFYAARGSVGRPVSHLYGEGWRGGFLAASIEQFLKLDMSKWLKVLRDLELLPRFMNQDWSFIWLQKFDGHVTILPKSRLSDWLHLLTDPDEKRLAHHLEVGMKQTFPKLHMIANRLRIERTIAQCRAEIKGRLDSRRMMRQPSDGTYSNTGDGSHAPLLLSEDSENTMKTRRKAAAAAAAGLNGGGGGRQAQWRTNNSNEYNDEEMEGGGLQGGGSNGVSLNGRKRRVASWPGLRYALGREAVESQRRRNEGHGGPYESESGSIEDGDEFGSYDERKPVAVDLFDEEFEDKDVAEAPRE